MTMTSHHWALIALASVTAPAAGQERPAAMAATCSSGQPAVGRLGLQGLSCNCTFYSHEANPAENAWRFREEPRIEGVEAGTSADGRLRAGDLIVAIDGVLITSNEGGRRFARLVPGVPVSLTVRRHGREHVVALTPEAVCPPEPPPAPAPGAPHTPPPAGLAVPSGPPIQNWAPMPTTPPPPPAPDDLTEGWFGFSIACSDCVVSTGERGAADRWEFGEPPLIERVERGSPAARAGLRDGDRITHIDGASITTAEAGARFGGVRPGDRVVLMFLREGVPRQVVLEVGQRVPGGRPPSAARTPRASPSPAVERFRGVVGDALVEVTGGVVSVTQTDDEIVIRSGDITVRVRRATH
jgi:membrane-associated protease RseP (regulator of RpoE activity)